MASSRPAARPRPAPERAGWPAAFLFLFLSGFCGLVYQVVWVRLAFSSFGIITPVLSVVVSVFMLGLGLGSWGAGPLLSAWRGRGWSPLTLYASIELLIGGAAAAVPALFDCGRRALLAAGAMDSPGYLAASAAAIALSLLPACALMGATIPVMMAFLEPRSRDRSSFSFLYLANAAGALLGVAATAAILVEELGFLRTSRAAVGLNVLLGLGAAALALRLESRGQLRERPLAAAPAPGRGRVDASPLIVLFATGFVAMGAEVLWTRAFTPVLGTTIYAFATVLGVYLLATGVGTFFYRRRRRSPAPQPPFRLLAAAAFAVYLPMLLGDPRLPGSGPGALLGLAVFCGLLGWLTPWLVETYSRGDAGAAGRAYAVNVAGCVLGPLAASYLLLPRLGALAGTACLATPLVLSILAFRRRAPARWSAGVLAGGALLTALLLGVCRSSEELGDPLGGPTSVRRDYAATVVAFGSGLKRSLFVNGVGITALLPSTKMMAHLPFRAFPGRPRSALMICFGMGTTYRSLLSLGLRTTAVELVPSVVEDFPTFHRDASAVLRNPGGRIVIDDGRRYLSRTSERYDLVTLDPPPPAEAAGSSLLYSREFYAQLKEHLSPHGIVQQWWPLGEARILGAVARSLRDSFPYVRVFKGVGGRGFHFLAAREPIRVRPAREYVAALPAAAARDLNEWSPGTPPLAWAREMTSRERSLDDILLRFGDGRAITDDRPYNEYYLLRRWRAGSVLFIE